MDIQKGAGTTEYGRGVNIDLNSEDVALAIEAWLVAHDVFVFGPRTIRVNGDLIETGSVYVDPSGFVISSGKKISGRK